MCYTYIGSKYRAWRQSMTGKNFKAIAEILKKNRASSFIILDMDKYLRTTNTAYDSNKFIRACCEE